MAMLNKTLNGSRNYWLWIGFLLALIAIGFAFYLTQLKHGLAITGMSRDVSWGLYIGQFTLLVGVAASAVMVVLPYYLHNVKEFGRITVLGEFLAIAAVIMCLLFIIVDMGMPARLLNMMLYPTLSSPMFWDMIVLSGYLILNVLIGWNVLQAEKNLVEPPGWVKPLIYISIPWAISIHTVTAFLYAGLPGKHYWLSGLIAPKFLASAFAIGPALLILFCFILKRYAGFDAGKEAINKLALIVAYGMVISVFMVAVEFFTAFYSQVPGHQYSLEYLFFGIGEYRNMVPLMWLFALLATGALVLLLNRKTRENYPTLAVACLAVFLAMFIEKGISFVVAGFIPNSFKSITQYAPTLPEVFISLGIWAMGLLLLTVLYKIAVEVKAETG
jgi:molybdopterin-containing oxidoreductase family membrane subunit